MKDGGPGGVTGQTIVGPHSSGSCAAFPPPALSPPPNNPRPPAEFLTDRWGVVRSGTGSSPLLSPPPRRPTPGVVKQDKSSGGSVDTTKTRSGPQRVRMSSGERPMGTAKGKQSDTEALCQSPPPPWWAQFGWLPISMTQDPPIPFHRGHIDRVGASARLASWLPRAPPLGLPHMSPSLLPSCTCHPHVPAPSAAPPTPACLACCAILAPPLFFQ